MINFRPNEGVSSHRSVFARPLAQGGTGALDERPVPNGAHAPTSDQLAGLCKRLYTMRSKRSDFLNPELFGEPGWDMLLALFNAESEGYKLTISSLCAASQCPATTSLRWLERLTQLDLIERTKSPTDARVFFVTMKPSARSAINSYLAKIWRGLYATG